VAGGLAPLVLLLISGLALLLSFHLLLVGAGAGVAAMERRRDLAEDHLAPHLRVLEEMLHETQGEIGGWSAPIEADVQARLDAFAGRAGVAAARLLEWSPPSRQDPADSAAGSPSAWSRDAAAVRGRGVSWSGRAALRWQVPGLAVQPEAAVRLLVTEAPLAKYPFFGYDLDALPGAAPGDSTFGLAAGGSFAQPMRHRIAYGDTAYRRLFSTERIEAEIAACGPAGVLNLDLGGGGEPHQQPRIDGVAWTGAREVRVRLSETGGALRRVAGRDIAGDGRRLVIGGNGGGRILLEQGSGASRAPVRILCVGPVRGSVGQLRVEVSEGFSVPCLLILVNSHLVLAAEPRTAVSAVYLDPDSTVGAGAGLTVCHVSAPAAKVHAIRLAGLRATLPMDRSLEEVLPRAFLVESSVLR
jgi:hypothetical protein